MSNEKKLLPCPFGCDAEVRFSPRAESVAHPGNYWPDQVVHNCKLTMGQMVIRGESEQAVIEAWNTRTDTSQQINRVIYCAESNAATLFFNEKSNAEKWAENLPASLVFDIYPLTLCDMPDTSQQQAEKPLPFCNECEEKDCQVSMDGYCNFIRRYKKSFEIERANKDLSQVNTRNSLLVAENMEQAERIQELEQQLAQHEWVSVEDKRKPAEGVHVFIYGIDGTVAIGKYWADIQKWLVADPRVATGLEVTHWKPIQAPNNSGE